MTHRQARRPGALVLLGLLLLLASHVRAQKVVMFYNAWPAGNYPFKVIGGWNGLAWQGPEAGGNDLPLSGPWYTKTLPASYNPNGGQNKIAFASADWRWKYGANGFGDQSDIDIASVLRTSDTVWIIPSPLPNGKPLLSGTRPKQVTVMFLSPWEGNPSLKIEAGGWQPLLPNARLGGWTSTFVLGFNSLSLLIRSPDSSQYFSSGGLSGLPVPMVLDSLWKTDTVWIRPADETSGAAIATKTRPRGKQVMVFNPWGRTKPIGRPAITFKGSGPLKMAGADGFCGWFSREFFARTPEVHFDDRRGQSFGAGGFGTTTPIDLAAVFARKDTAWIVADPATGLPLVRDQYSGETGLCEFSLLAATVRDFDTTHPEFEKGWKGVVKRMVLPKLGADRKPIKNPSVHHVIEGGARVGDTTSNRIGIDWFKTVPGVNTETCRDIPLALDTLRGTYGYDNQNFFPIDDFKTLPDGSPNPRYHLQSGSDGAMHNFSFCMESHGEFDYKKGQTFRFRGDDDVWFFVDGHLSVDLGGVHGPASDSVRLDDIGYRFAKRTVGGTTVTDTLRDTTRVPLVEGKTYNFDFFFCERQTGGSSLRIETDMNMRTRNGFQVKDSTAGTGIVVYDLYVSQTTGQGCQAQNLVVKTSGRFFLEGTGMARRPLATGRTHFGGIVLDALNSRATIDSAAIAGLPAGDYLLLAMSDLDTTRVVEIPFRVPYTTGPRFVSKPAFTGATGSSLAIEVAAFNVKGPDSTSIAFTMQPDAGLVYYRDSALTSPLASGDTLRTGVNHAPRRLWVKGVLPGTYTLAVGKILGDSSDLWPNVVFLPSRPVFKIRSPYTGTVGGVVAMEVVAVNDLGTDSSITTFGLRPLAGIEVFADSLLTRRLLATDTLRTGSNGLPRRLWARGTLAGSYTLVVGGTSLDSTDARPDIVFQDKGLRFTTASGVLLDPFAVEKPLGDSLRLWFETFAGTTTCTTCGSRVALSSSLSGIEFLGTGNALADTVELVGGRGSVLVRANRPVDLATLGLQVVGDSASRALWSPVSFTVAGPDSAKLLDRDGDGRADALVVHLQQPWAATNTVSASWPDATTTLVLGDPFLSGDSLTATFPVAGAGLATTGTSAGTWSWDASTTSRPFAVSERIAAVPMRAVLSRGTVGAPDTLRARLSESVVSDSVTNVLQSLVAGAWNTVQPSSASLPGSTTIEMVFAAGATSPSVGDSVRLSDGVADLLRNLPGTPRRAIVVEGATRPPLAGWLLDLDGDGAMDHARIRLPESVVPDQAGSFVFRIGPGSLERRGRAPVAVPGAPELLQVELETPFPGATTSFPSGAIGILWRDSVPTLDGSTGREDLFALSDSAAPWIRSAFLRLTESYDAPDTLVVVATEPVVASGTRFLLGHDRLTESVMDLAGSSWISPETLLVLQWPTSPSSLRAGDSVRWSPDGDLRDLPGNAPLPLSQRRVVTGGVRSPMLRVVPPRALTVFSEEQQFTAPSLPGIQILGGMEASPRVVDPSTGALTGGTPCPETRCIGPTLELNQPVRVTLFVYDRLGVHVAGTDLEVTQSILDAIGTDRLGRTSLRLRWDLADTRAKPVAGGVYLMRLLVSRQSEQGKVLVANQVWKVGVKRGEVP
jgi:fibro-slime domain-containing protein